MLDLAGTAVFLASRASDFVTGTTVVVSNRIDDDDLTVSFDARRV